MKRLRPTDIITTPWKGHPVTTTASRPTWLLTNNPGTRGPGNDQLTITTDTSVHDVIHWLAPCIDDTPSAQQNDARAFIDHLAWLLVNSSDRLTVADCRDADCILGINIIRQ